MEVVISGQAGIYASVKPPVLYSLDNREAISLKTHNLGLAFQGCNDAKRVQVDTIDQAREVCEASWANDRSLRCILMFLDSSEVADDRLEFAECVEELISDFSTGAFLLNQLSCSPLPPSADLGMLDRLQESCPQTLAVLHQIVRDQPIIEGVSEALQSKLKEVFEDGRQRSSFFELLVDVGASRGLVDAIRDNSNIDMLVMRWIGQFRHIEGARRLIESWTAGMRSKKRINVPSAPDTEEFEDFESSRQAAAGSGRRAFEQAMKQQAAIVSKLKSRDLDGARRFVDDLIATQKVSSSPEHIGKSLSNLSHEAKELGVPELHIEWAEEAVKANPSDPITFSHLSDALISAFRFNEAFAAIESMESLGASLAAASARARILRMTGRFEEARVVYLAAAQSNPFDPTVTYVLQGAAEVLRDMSRYEESLSEYTKLTETYPLEGSIWAGRASVLMDLGRFDEAISTFRISETHGSARVPKNGRATAYKRRGELTKALKLYDEVVREFPNDPVALCGRAEVYRDQGNLDAALIDFRIAVERSPFTPTPIMGLVETLIDLRRFNEAIDLINKAVQQFPLHAGLASLRAGLLSRQSKFEDALAAYDDLIGQFAPIEV
jgi:tetratricopeptide (TPR) repeat protein